MTFEEYKEIFEWVSNKSERSTARDMGMAIEIAKVINGKEETNENG